MPELALPSSQWRAGKPDLPLANRQNMIKMPAAHYASNVAGGCYGGHDA